MKRMWPFPSGGLMAAKPLKPMITTLLTQRTRPRSQLPDRGLPDCRDRVNVGHRRRKRRVSARSRSTHMAEPGADPAPQAVTIDGKQYFVRKRRDGAGMELIKAVPDDTADPNLTTVARRTAAVAAYDGYTPSPRQSNDAAITEPLSTRCQTILSHQADAELQASLDGWCGRPTGRR